ncbi:MAG: hypothetical protein ACI9G1_001916 [Pirellulaceae bacterium]|jgi:hypothetical protein
MAWPAPNQRTERYLGELGVGSSLLSQLRYAAQRKVFEAVFSLRCRPALGLRRTRLYLISG